MIGWGLFVFVVAALLAIGIGGMVAPRRASEQYGIVAGDAHALRVMRAMAARDLVIGGLLAIVALVATRNAVGWAMWLTAVIAAVDFLVVAADLRARSRSRMAPATMLHGSGAVGLLITGGLLMAGC